MPQTDRINFRISPELRRILQRVSKRYDRSESDFIRDALWEWLEKKGHAPGAAKRKGGKAKK